MLRNRKAASNEQNDDESHTLNHSDIWAGNFGSDGAIGETTINATIKYADQAGDGGEWAEHFGHSE
jgi:hypothetical protein